MSKISDRVKNAISNEKAVGFVMGASVVSVAVLTIVTKSAIDALAKSEGAFVGAMDFIEQKKLIQEYTTYVVEKTSNK